MIPTIEIYVPVGQLFSPDLITQEDIDLKMENIDVEIDRIADRSKQAITEILCQVDEFENALLTQIREMCMALRNGIHDRDLSATANQKLLKREGKKLMACAESCRAVKQLLMQFNEPLQYGQPSSQNSEYSPEQTDKDEYRDINNV